MLMVVILVNQMLLKVALNTIASNPKYFCHPIHDVIVTFVFRLLDF